MTTGLPGSLAFGHPQLDEDHATLIAIMAELRDAMAEGRGEAVVGSIICRLADFMVWHFGREERLMERSHHPEYAAHKAEHDDLIRRLGELAHRSEPADDRIAADVLAFLDGWLTAHIPGADRRLVAFLEGAGGGG